MNVDKIEQNNEQGTNIVIINVLNEVLRRYENVLCINEEISFLDDATENLIRDSRIFLEDVNIDRVRNCLDEKKACLIMAPEGRGKTYLSRIIAYKYHHEQRMEVFFLDFKDSNRLRDNNSISIGEFQDKLQEWHKIKEKNYLLVLENVHAYHYLSALKELIVTRLRIPDNHTWFLLNARPTDTELEDFSDWEEQTVDLKPDIKNINGIINLYAKELGREPFGGNEQDRTAFIERIYPHENNPVGANLRLLSIYLKTWQKHPEKQYITDIDEQTILKDFRKTYLENKSSKEKEILWYISCLYQFDVPLHEDLNQEVGNFENDFLRYDGSQYHLPHSVDAYFLFRAICDYKNSNCCEKTREFVKYYVNTILASSNPRKFEGDFRLLRHGLIERKDEFQILINELADWPMAKRIISNIDPSFIITAFDTRNGHTKETILSSYTKDKEIVLPYILELSPGKLSQLWNLFENFLNYNDFYLDVFENPDILQKYLMKWYKLLNTTSSLRVLKDGVFKKKIMDISQKHALIVNYKPPVRNKYRFNTTPKKNNRFFIFNRSVAYLYTTNATDFERFLRQINKKNGFYFKNCSWTHLGKMIHIIQSKSNDGNKTLCVGAERKIIQAIVNKINIDPNAIQKATNEELSRFFYAVSDFDKTIFDNLMKKDIIITDAKFRLSWFDYSFSEFNLFSHFYSQPWCKAKMNELIDQANTEQKIVIKGWHDKVITKLNHNAVQIEKDSLLDYIHNKFYNQEV